jgi:hypothetical protein
MTKKQQRIAERGALIYQGAIDYLTCSTYNGDQYALVVNMIDSINVSRETIKARKAKGYDTSSLGWASYGEGTQKGNHNQLGGLPHFVINANGQEADKLALLMLKEPLFNPEEWNWSRVDIQLTVKKNRAVRLTTLGQRLDDGLLGEFRGKGKPKPHWQGSSTGDTLYIGSPKSQRMIRFYDKPLVHQRTRQDFERFEVQYRDDYANPLMRKLFRDRNKLDRDLIMRTLKREYDKLPEALQMELSFYHAWENVSRETIQPDKTEATESSKLRWLKSLRKSLIALASAPGQAGVEARGVLLEALVLGTTSDPLAAHMDYRLLSPDSEIWEPLAIVADRRYPSA